MASWPRVDLPWLVARNPGGAALPNAVVSHYRLLNELGSGGMGVVYRAEDTALGRTVALKFLPPEICHDAKRVQRLRHEARTASSLNHPNICTIYEVAEDQGELFIAMEYVEGQPLSELVRKRGMPIETILRYAQQIAAALEHAHDRGIIHRDLKPVNVVITPSGDAKILDFGLAKRADTEVPRKTTDAIATDSSIGLTGTLPYMSPEQLEGGEAGPRSDIWSFGVMLYELAAGERPFRGENLYRLCSAILQDPPPPLPDHIPTGLAGVIRRCLEKEPVRRYQRASEVRAALQALDPSAAVSREPARGLKARRKVALWISLITAALVVAGAWVGFALRKTNGPNAALKAALEPMQLAVLPPTGGVKPEETAFDNGLAETLTSRLTELTSNHSLAVIPASEVRARKVGTLDEAHAQFGVNLGLLISVQHAAGQKRVTYALVEARSHRQLRGATITAPNEDPFTLQDRVSDSVAQALELQLEPQEKNAFQAHGTTEPTAYDFYLQGRGYLQDYGKQENIENAITVFQRALQRDPAFAGAFAGLGEAYWRKYELTHETHWVDEATEACKSAARRSADLAEAHVCLGRVYSGTGQNERAAEEYKKAAQLDPTLDSAQSGLASAYVSLKQLDRAEEAFRASIALRPNYWAGYNRLGMFYLQHGKFEPAAQMFSQVVSLAPDSFIGYNNLGDVRLYQGRNADAIPLLERSLQIRKTPDATSNLGTAYFQLQRYAEAAAAYEQATHFDPQNYILWGNLGDAYFWTPGRRQDAGPAYRKAINLARGSLGVNRRDALALSCVSLYHAMLGERGPALEYMSKAIKLEPRRPDLLLNAAIAYAQLGEPDRALETLEKAVAMGLDPAQLRQLPNFGSLRDKPRFKNLFPQS